MLYRALDRLPVFWRQVRWVPGWLLLGYLMPPGIVFIGLAGLYAGECLGESRVGRSLAGERRDRRDHSRWHWVVPTKLNLHPAQIAALAMTLRLFPTVGLVGFLIRVVLLTIAGCVAGRLLFVVVERHFLSPALPSGRLAPGPAGTEDQSVALGVSRS